MTRINVSATIVAASFLSSSVEGKRTSRASTSSNRRRALTKNTAANAKKPDSTPTVFVCGSSLQEATQAAQSSPDSASLCPTGQDQCPPQQHCYAVVGVSSSPLHQRQSHQEEMFIDNLIRKREEGIGAYSDGGFVCGTSWEDALQSVWSAESSSRGPIHCSVSSSSCPSDMECYASVSCLREKRLEEQEKVAEHWMPLLPVIQNLSSHELEVAYGDSVRLNGLGNLLSFGSC